jgi:hypothetical protein
VIVSLIVVAIIGLVVGVVISRSSIALGRRIEREALAGGDAAAPKRDTAGDPSTFRFWGRCCRCGIRSEHSLADVPEGSSFARCPHCGEQRGVAHYVDRRIA